MMWPACEFLLDKTPQTLAARRIEVADGYDGEGHEISRILTAKERVTPR